MDYVNITLDICGLIITIAALAGLGLTIKVIKRKHVLPGAIGIVALLGVIFDLISYAGFWSDDARNIVVFLTFVSILLWSGNLAFFICKDIKSNCKHPYIYIGLISILFVINTALYFVLWLSGRLFTLDGVMFVPGVGVTIVTLVNIFIFAFLLAICFLLRRDIPKNAFFIYVNCLTAPLMAIIIDRLIPGIATAYFLCDLCTLICFFTLYGMEMTESNLRLLDTQTKSEELAAEQEAQIEEITQLNDQLDDTNKKLDAVRGMLEGLSQEYHTIWLVNKETLRMKLIRTTGVSTIKEAVQMAIDIVGYDSSLDRYISKYVVEEDRERMKRSINSEEVLRQLTEPGLYVVNYLRRDEDGNVAYHQMAFANADSPDGIPRFVLGFRDIDEILKEEEAYKQELRDAKLAAEAANRSKTIFLNNLSHDIRTPMNAILGYTHLMHKEKDNPEQISDYLSKIERSGDYLLSIINNVLELARIDSGKEEVDEEFTDLLDPSCSVYPLLENELKAKNLNFTNEMKNVTHRHVFADMDKIREITMNLMSNAIKYTPEGGSITLTFEEIPSQKEGYATYVNSVSDTGIGMSEEFRQVIFDAFSRERNTTDSKIMGTGLGMSIVKKLVDLMDGKIQVESELGKGTTFRVILSHKIVESPEKYLSKMQERISRTNIRFNGEKILLAEDNDLNAEIATAILEDAGLCVKRAIDGVDCLDIYAKAEPGDFRLILMDIQMPNMNGYQTTEQIRNMQDEEKAQIPIVAMTANAFDEDRQAALDAGMSGHVSKPINVKELLRTIDELLK